MIKYRGWRGGGMVDLPAGRRAGLKKMYFVYILKSLKTNKYYKGLTNNIDRRMQEHFCGESPTTKSMLPVELVHVEVCEFRTEARMLERFFKSGYGREVIKEINNSLHAEVAEW